MIRRLLRRIGIILTVMTTVWAATGFQSAAIAAPAAAVPVIPFEVGNDLQPVDGTTYDTKHYLDAAGWIVTVGALPNHGNIDQLDDPVIALAKRIVNDNGITGLTADETKHFRVGYALATHSLSLTRGKKWWTFGLFSSCTGSPVPQSPGRGFSGWLDAGPTAIDPAAQITPTTVYATVQYPPQWHTYDLGCIGKVTDPGASLDTTIGNWEMGFATSLIAMSNSLHRVVVDPTFLQKLNPLLVSATAGLKHALFDPWIDLSLLVVGIGIMWSARRKALHYATTAFTWAILIMGVVTVIFEYPIQAARTADEVSATTVGAVNDGVLGTPTAGTDPSLSRAELLTDNVLYKQWLRGEVGSATSAVAVKYGPLLLDAQTNTYTEAAAAAADPEQAAKIQKRKQDQFNKVAQAIKREDPSAYSTLQGSGTSRIGVGIIAILSAVLTVPFMIAADLVVLAALLVIRMLIIFFPPIGVIGVHHRLRKFAILMGAIGAAALINSTVFNAAAAVNASAVGTLLGGTLGLNEWLAVVICGLFTYILWGAMKPFRRLTSMVGAGAVKGATEDQATARGPRKMLGKVGAVAAGVAGGEWLGRHHRQDQDDDTPAPSTDRPETWSRPEPVQTAPPRSAPPEPRPDPDPYYESLYATEVLPSPDGDWGVPPGEAEQRTEPLPTQPLPDEYRADPTVTEDGVVYRIWDSESREFVTVDREEVEEAHA